MPLLRRWDWASGSSVKQVKQVSVAGVRDCGPSLTGALRTSCWPSRGPEPPPALPPRPWPDALKEGG
eukprot:4958193-Pyramimonas_sp.AAC.1